MSNPLDPLVETLKAAEPRPEAVDRAVAALRRPHPPRLVPLAAAVAALSIVVLWPRGESGVAWAQIAAKGQPGRYILREELVRGGKRRLWSTYWRDAPAGSMKSELYTRPGEEAVFLTTPEFSYQRLGDRASLQRGGGGSKLYVPYTAQPIEFEKLLGDKEVRQLGVDRGFDSRVGKADRYRLDRFATEYTGEKGARAFRGYRQRFDVFVDPTTKNVLGWDDLGRGPTKGARYTVEYPAAIDPGVFALPRTRGVRVYDLDAAHAAMAKALRKPLATARVEGVEISLRLVIQDHSDGLWTFWTGAPLKGDLSRRVRVLGEKNLAAFGLAVFVSKDARGYRSPFSGHGVKIGRQVSKVDLQIPVFAGGRERPRFVGSADFRDVPVIPIDTIYSAYGELKMDSRKK